MPLKTSDLEKEMNTIMKDGFNAGLKEFMDQMSGLSNAKAKGDADGVVSSARAAASTKFADTVAPKLSKAVETFVKSATVKAITIPPGQAVATAGSPAAQTGATTAPVQSTPLVNGLE
jgi:hypothetical protein